MNNGSIGNNPWNSVKVLVVGLGISGRAAVRFLLRRGAIVTAVDRSQEILSNDVEVENLRQTGASIIHQDELQQINTFATIVLSPGIPPNHPIVLHASALGIPIIGEVELALRELKIPCIGITGTNGKTTVTLLTTHVLNCCGKKAVALGNVGVPLAEGVDNLEEQGCQYAVVELSSFQIDTLHLPCLDVGVLLNITPDHLDRYGTIESYASSKARIATLMKSQGVLYVYEECARDYPNLFESSRVELYGYSQRCRIRASEGRVFASNETAFILPEKYTRGRSHEVENFMAAYAICHHFGVSGEQFLAAAATFVKPRHRIEFVKEVRGVMFYDDSKGTNIDAVIRAVETLKGEIILIAGGVDKGAPYFPWIPVFRNKVRAICAIGEASVKMQGELGEEYPVTLHENLEMAVYHAFTISRPGDQILLSPGCSSYDMFRDYAHRGEEFQRIVNTII